MFTKKRHTLIVDEGASTGCSQIIELARNISEHIDV